jgi:hypothetical protein
VITDQQFINWLSNEHADRVVLYEQDYIYEESGGPVGGTLYLSDKPFAPLDAERPYVDRIASVPDFERSLGGNRLNTYSSSIGSVDIINTDGDLDFYLDLAIDGSEARFYIGDKSWDRADFRLIFSVYGLIVRRAPLRRLTIDLKDSTALLNQSIGGESLVGGSGPNANQERPLNFGFIHNLTPLSLDSINLTYVHSDTGGTTSGGNVEAIEVRDDGVPVLFNDNGDGTLELNSSPAGLITCDVEAYPLQSSSGDHANVSDAFDYLVGERAGFVAAGLYIGPHPTFVEDDVDDYPIGISVAEARNILDILGELTESGNCFAAITRVGEFTFGRLKPYDVASFGLDPVDIGEGEIVPRTSFDVQHLTPEYYRYQAYAHRNWTQQSNLSAVLNPDEQARFSRKGQFALQALVGGTTYALAPELYHKTLSTSPPLETLLSWDDDSSIIYLTQYMETRRAMFLPWLEVVTVSVPLGANPDAPKMFYALELGDVVRVTITRFGYDAGVLFQVIAVGINLTKTRTILRLVRKRGVIQTPLEWRSLMLPTVGVGPGAGPQIGPPLVGRPLVSFGGIGGSGGAAPPEEDEAGVYYFDTFTGSDALNVHAPDIGTTYSADPDYQFASAITCAPNAAFLMQAASGNAFGADPAYAIQPITTEGDDYAIGSRFGWSFGIEGYDPVACYFLARKTGDTFYLITIDCGSGATSTDYADIKLERIVSGISAGMLDNDLDLYLPPDVAHTLYWRFEGSDIKVYIDGTLILDTDDSGGINGPGEEIGFGSENNGGVHGYSLVKWDWVICHGLDVNTTQYDIYSFDAASVPLVMGPDVAGMRTIEYPSTSGNIDIELSLAVMRSDITYSLNYTGGTFTGVTFGSPTHADPRFCYGTFVASAEATPVVMTIVADFGAGPVAILPEIQLVPV